MQYFERRLYVYLVSCLHQIFNIALIVHLDKGIGPYNADVRNQDTEAKFVCPNNTSTVIVVTTQCKIWTPFENV